MDNSLENVKVDDKISVGLTQNISYAKNVLEDFNAIRVDNKQDGSDDE